MARSPIYSNQTRLRWSETWIDDSKAVVDLTNPDTSNATITLKILYPDNTSHLGTGAVTPVDQKNGRFKYQVVPGDFPAPSLPNDAMIKYRCQYLCTYANGEILDGDFFDVFMAKAI